jgi:mRNA interferase MazF
VLVLQTDLLNDVHPSTIACPLTTAVQQNASVLRVHMKRGQAGLEKDSDVIVDQIRAIDSRRLLSPLGPAPPEVLAQVLRNLALLLEWP